MFSCKNRGLMYLSKIGGGVREVPQRNFGGEASRKMLIKMHIYVLISLIRVHFER